VLWSRSNCVFHLLKVVTVTFLFLELVVGALSFRLNMANSRWLGVTSIFAAPRATCESGCGPNMRAMRVAYTRARVTLTDRPAIMSVQCYTGRPYLCLARNMADGRWPTVIMHTAHGLLVHQSRAMQGTLDSHRCGEGDETSEAYLCLQ